ncbi:MAG: metallophosphoesterase family protein [Kiritimatiellae bacterium]|nr:metallophosphoesterase family protein [Kiritimatiellia bacterium]
MRHAVFSDVHANLSALKRVLEDARQNGVRNFVCLGDIVGYGPQPAECIALVRKKCSLVVAGNHDDAVSGRMDAAQFIGLAADSAERHRKALSQEALHYLSTRPYSCFIAPGIRGVHADATDSPKFYYTETEEDAAANFRAVDDQLIFLGHTHIPALFVTGKSGKVYKTAPQDFTLEPDKRYIVNVGSVGYPREADGKCFSSYVIYDDEERTVTYRFLPFSVASVMERGKGAAPVQEKPENPRNKRLALLALGLAVVSAIVAVATVAVARNARLREDARAEEAQKDAPFAVKDLQIGVMQTQVRANLTLNKKSPPVILRIDFYAPGDAFAESVTKVVKASSKGKFAVPAKAVRAKFSLFRQTPADIPLVNGFEPSAER